MKSPQRYPFFQMSDGILKREGAEDYIPATEAEQAEMLCKVGESSLDGLFDCRRCFTIE